MTVIAQWSDGTSAPLTNAVWSSRTPHIAAITRDGFLTGISPGRADLSVVIDGQTQGGQMTVLPKNPRFHQVEGKVHMVAPSEHVVFPGVPVHITWLAPFVDLPSVTTDANGRFNLTLEEGSYRFEVRIPGDYFPQIQTVAVSRDMTVTLAVRPGAGSAVDMITVERGQPPVAQVSAAYAVHHNPAGFSFGLLRACFDDTCGPTEVADVCVEVRDGDNRLFGELRIPVGSTAYRSLSSVIGGRVYTVKVYACDREAFRPAAGVVFRELALEVRRSK